MASGCRKRAEQAAQGVAEVGQHAAGAAAGRGEDVDARRVVDEGQARLLDRFVQRVRMRDFLNLAPQPGQQTLLIVGERQPAQGARALRLQRARHAVKLVARQPFRQLIQAAPAIIDHRLQRQRIVIVAAQRHLRRTAARHLSRVRIGIEIQKTQQRQLAQIAEAIEEIGSATPSAPCGQTSPGR